MSSPSLHNRCGCSVRDEHDERQEQIIQDGFPRSRCIDENPDGDAGALSRSNPRCDEFAEGNKLFYRQPGFPSIPGYVARDTEVSPFL